MKTMKNRCGIRNKVTAENLIAFFERGKYLRRSTTKLWSKLNIWLNLSQKNVIPEILFEKF